jgi:hypothetical protein
VAALPFKPISILDMVWASLVVASLVACVSATDPACKAVDGSGMSDKWCQSNCPEFCPPSLCICTGPMPTWAPTPAPTPTPPAPPATCFPDSAVFERLQHFKDVGLPNTLHDPFNRAAIADGTCRTVTGRADPVGGGYACWHSNEDKVNAVLSALDALPSSDSPSKMTLAAKATLPAVCTAPAPASNDLSFYNSSVAAGSLQAWFRALCDETWDDPAYQPQQVALTVGFACAMACDAAGKKLDANAVDTLARSVDSASQSKYMMCLAITYAPDYFAKLTSFEDIAKATANWRNKRPCQC